MKRLWILGLVFLGLEALLFLAIRAAAPPAPTSAASRPVAMAPAPAAPAASQELQYRIHSLAQAEVHTLLIPAQGPYRLAIAQAAGVDTLKGFAANHQAIAVLNGGFFDPANQKSTSYIVIGGQQVADPQQNERLMNNPELAPYLDNILNRSEFRQYRCGEAIRYAIALHRSPAPAQCQIENAIGAGPQLLPDLTLQQEGFLDIASGSIVRDSLNHSQPNARTAIGITRAGDLLWVMVAQKPDAPLTSGMSLQALSDFLSMLGVETAMNLDGGGSASLYYDGKTVYGDVDAQGQPIERPVHSALVLQRR